MCGSMVDTQSPTAKNRRGKEENAGKGCPHLLRRTTIKRNAKNTIYCAPAIARAGDDDKTMNAQYDRQKVENVFKAASQHYVDAADCYRRSSVVCPSVCLSPS